MKRCNILIGLALATWLATAPEVFAQSAAVTLTVDENGHGTARIPGSVFTLQASRVLDPGPGGLAGALTYSFSSPLAPGSLMNEHLSRRDRGIVNEVAIKVHSQPAPEPSGASAHIFTRRIHLRPARLRSIVMHRSTTVSRSVASAQARPQRLRSPVCRRHLCGDGSQQPQ
jgi:hypothetical protein